MESKWAFEFAPQIMLFVFIMAFFMAVNLAPLIYIGAIFCFAIGALIGMKAIYRGLFHV